MTTPQVPGSVDPGTIPMQFEFTTFLRPAYDLPARLRAKLEVAACTDCAACTLPHHPAVATTPGPPPFAVVAPSPVLWPETRRLLQALLPTYAAQVPVIGWASCDDAPRIEIAKSKVRACRHRFWQQVRALQYPPLLLVDGYSAWRDDLNPMTVCGNAYVWGHEIEPSVDGKPPGGVWCMPIGNVRAVGQGAGSMERLKGWIERFVEAVETEPDPAQMWDISDEEFIGIGDEVGFARWLKLKCVMCGSPNNIQWDCDAVPYCGAHYDQCGLEWKKQRMRWL